MHGKVCSHAAEDKGIKARRLYRYSHRKKMCNKYIFTLILELPSYNLLDILIIFITDFKECISL